MLEELARLAVRSGFKVWIGQTGKYGIYSDDRAARIVHFYPLPSGIAFNSVYWGISGPALCRLPTPRTLDAKRLQAMLYSKRSFYMPKGVEWVTLYERLTLNQGEFKKWMKK